ncbi:mannosyltransferase [Rhodococcoides kyotonense]|uniref:Alpha-1,2-mannosyltransferase n=1 Tax=Rhodococcoides kyotonense TaxID=398843 RepID=A0A239I8X3_9NOCA|nr:mannosyltransferase [Rhodococcus kyotonensis]SNS89503.1 alpha-1,2-mannosyltransferase [Rhodococcus kyotonensis]
MNRLVRCAPVLLLLSVVARFAWAFLTPNGMNLVDLHVYVDGSAALLRDDLYDFTYSEETPDFPLPFTYPPFAALVFFPLHYLPFTLVGVCWQLATMVALFFLIRLSLDLVDPDRDWTRIAMLWTAVALWTEPVRTTLDYGQVNVFLALGALVAIRSSRWWVAGGLVGVIAGIKLTPAITGLYFVATKRWKAAVFSAVAFGATVGLSYLILGHQAGTYFTTLLGDADRIGPVGSVWNQSLRGAMSRIAGHDVGSGLAWILGVVVCAALAFFAWRALRPGDRLGTLIVVQLLGLLISPISWSHHWVWVMPLLVWLVHGRDRHRLGTKVVATYWLATTLVGVPWILSFFQDSIWLVSRPGVLAWLGAVDVVGVLLVYGWTIHLGRINRREEGHLSDARDARPSS